MEGKKDKGSRDEEEGEGGEEKEREVGEGKKTGKKEMEWGCRRLGEERWREGGQSRAAALRSHACPAAPPPVPRSRENILAVTKAGEFTQSCCRVLLRLAGPSPLGLREPGRDAKDRLGNEEGEKERERGRGRERGERSNRIVWQPDVAYFDQAIAHALEELSVATQRRRLQISCPTTPSLSSSSEGGGRGGAP